LEGNYVDGSIEVTNNNWKGVTMDKGTDGDALNSKLTQPITAIQVPTQKAEEAYELVLQYAGASFRRDTLDQRIINDVKNRTGRFIDVQGGWPHGTPYIQSAMAWPILQSKPAEADSDGDGMPNAWEIQNGLNPNDPNDSSKNTLHKHYTNIEVFINSLLK
jgi:hypothetical protein